MEATSWYKDRKKENEEEEEDEPPRINLNTWKKYREKVRRKNGFMKTKKKEIKEKVKEEKKKIQGVIFIEHTSHSELASRVRERLRDLEKVSNLKIKIVEKAGEKIVDLLHKSNSWSKEDCQREDCIVCSSKTEKEERGAVSKDV